MGKTKVSKEKKVNENNLVIEPDGAFCFAGNEFRKIYHLGEKDDNFQPQELVENLNSKIRITKRFGKNKYEVFLTLSLEGEYEEVREKFIKDERILEKIFEIQMLSPESLIQSFYGANKDFLHTMKKNKKGDWKSKYLPVLDCKDNYFLFDGMYGECLFVMNFPETLSAGICKALRQLECEIQTSTEISSISDIELTDYNRAMEEKYHRRISNDREQKILNVSEQIVFFGDSDDARKIIENTILSIYTNRDYMISVGTGFQNEIAESVFSLGTVSFHNRRNVNAQIVDTILSKEELWQ